MIHSNLFFIQDIYDDCAEMDQDNGYDWVAIRYDFILISPTTGYFLFTDATEEMKEGLCV